MNLHCLQITIKYHPEALDFFIECADEVEAVFSVQVDGEEDDSIEGHFQVIGSDGNVLLTANLDDCNSDMVIKALTDSGLQ